MEMCTSAINCIKIAPRRKKSSWYSKRSVFYHDRIRNVFVETQRTVRRKTVKNTYFSRFFAAFRVYISSKAFPMPAGAPCGRGVRALRADAGRPGLSTYINSLRPARSFVIPSPLLTPFNFYARNARANIANNHLQH